MSKNICAEATSEAYEQAREKNKQLKELLKECKPLLNSHPRKFKLKYLLTRINSAIGESEE